MANARHIIRAVALHTGIAEQDVADIANALIRSGAWFEIRNPLAYVLLAVMAEATPTNATSIARHYYHLLGANAVVGELLEKIIDVFMHRQRTTLAIFGYKTRFEVFTNCAAVRINVRSSDGDFEATYGDDGNLPSGRHYTILTGKALFEIVAEISLAESAAVA